MCLVKGRVLKNSRILYLRSDLAQVKLFLLFNATSQKEKDFVLIIDGRVCPICVCN